MNAEDRNTEAILLRLQALGGCDTEQKCSCTLHALLLRLIAEYRESREQFERKEADRQEALKNAILDTDFE
jgi:hypothetical protein